MYHCTVVFFFGGGGFRPSQPDEACSAEGTREIPPYHSTVRDKVPILPIPPMYLLPVMLPSAAAVYLCGCQRDLVAVALRTALRIVEADVPFVHWFPI